MDNRPTGRQRNVTGQGSGIDRRGSGLGTGGPVGRSDGYAGRNSGSGGSRGSGSGSSISGIKLSPILIIIIVLFIIFFGKKLGIGGGSSEDYSDTGSSVNYSDTGSSLSQITSFGGQLSGVSTGWSDGSNTGRLDTTVASAARAKRTTILGNGRDVVTIMVYMCGTDLESKSGMASSDLSEMASAALSSNVNVIVYTGGCKQWKTQGISNTVNQIYKVESGGKIKCLVQNDGSDPMTKSSTLTRFIKYCNSNYPANRNILIFWDHGGGSISGYGYDERNPSSGSMTLKGINDALSASGTTFDFIGFDACLMATFENALMLEKYADYMIGSEETEPGVGWYYTNWLSSLSANTSLSTLEIGKLITDDFVEYCARKCPGQKTTLSVTDLAELGATVPSVFTEFATETASLIKSDDYKKVSDARAETREFAASSKTDQIDLAHLAINIGTDSADKLADAIRGAVKYNRTSSDITNAYGLAIYFPYQRTSKVDSAVKAYEAIGMDDAYAQCIRSFASLEVAGQAVSGGTQSSSPLPSLLGSFTGQSSLSSGGVSDILGTLLGGNFSSIADLGSGNTSFFGRDLNMAGTASYLAENQFDQSALTWKKSGGKYVMQLSEKQWSLVHDLELNVFYDDGSGFIDLGLDNVFEFTESGDLIGSFAGTWLAIDNQPVAYYHTDTTVTNGETVISGFVPVLLNGSRAELIIVFDNAHPSGHIAGARYVYENVETETVAKGTEGLQKGDKIDFLCDYYSYDGVYQDSYMIGKQLVYTGDHTVSDVYIDVSRVSATYLFTDIYNREYWTQVIPD